jgi:hypothetical protein
MSNRVLDFLRRNRNRNSNPAPVISSPYGPVSESARLQAVANMLASPEIRMRVEEVVIRECGGDRERGLRECRRRYREAYPGGM